MLISSMLTQSNFIDDGPTFTIKAPKDGSVLPPGMYMLFVTNNHIPSVAKWGRSTFRKIHG